MPVDVRSDSRVWNLAVRRLSPEVAAVPNANTGRSLFPGAIELGREVAMRIGRRLAIAAPLASPAMKREMPWHTDGSWPSFGKLLTHETSLRNLLTETVNDPSAIDPEIFDTGRIGAAVEEHFLGRRDHGEFLMLLLTFGGWHRKYGPAGNG
jgi:hypothetical protein